MERERIDAAGVADVGLGLAGKSLEIALVPIGVTNALRIFVELAGVEGLRKQVFENDGVRYADRLQVAHRRDQLAVRNRVVAVKRDLAHLNRGAFFDDEGQRNGCGRQRLDFGLDRGELVTMLGEQLLQDNFGPLDLGRVVLALDRERHFGLLEPFQYVGLCDRAEALIFDLADRWALAHINDQLHAGWRIDFLEPHVIEVTGVPKRVEIALDDGGIVGVSGARVQTRED